MRHAAALALLTVAAVALSLPSTAQRGGYQISEIVTIAQDLGKQLECPEEKIGSLLTNLKKAVEDDSFKTEAAKRNVTGVFVYRAAEAGLLLKILRGHGLVTFRNGRKAGEFTVRSTSFGAHVGGSAEWCIGLVLGLTDQAKFGGDYSGRMRRATAIDSNSADAVIFTPSASPEGAETHQIFLVVSGRGLSAGTGGAKLTITPAW